MFSFSVDDFASFKKFCEHKFAKKASLLFVLFCSRQFPFVYLQFIFLPFSRDLLQSSFHSSIPHL